MASLTQFWSIAPLKKLIKYYAGKVSQNSCNTVLETRRFAGPRHHDIHDSERMITMVRSLRNSV